MKQFISFMTTLVLWLSAVEQLAAGLILFGVADNSPNPQELMTINTATGAASTVGPLGDPGFFVNTIGLAVDLNTNTMYAIDDAGVDYFLTIDPSTGVGTYLADTSASDWGGMAFDPNTNTLYGSGGNRLFTIDPSNAGATDVGPLGFSGVEGLAFDPNTNTLYGTDTDTVTLITINTSTGAGAAVGSLGALGFDDVRGLAFDPINSTLYGSDMDTDQLITINTSTGLGTAVGPLGVRQLQGLAFASETPLVPEPSSLLLASMAAVGMAASLAWQRRRKRAQVGLLTQQPSCR